MQELGARGESPLRYRSRLGNVLQLLSRKRKRAVFSDFSHGLLGLCHEKEFGSRSPYYHRGLEPGKGNL